MPTLALPEMVTSLLMAFVPCFTAPSFRYFQEFVWYLMVGWGRRVCTNVWLNGAQDRHYNDYSRFVSQYVWCPRELAQQLLELLLAHLPRRAWGRHKRRLVVAVDDRPVTKSRGKMPGLGWHHRHNHGCCRGPFVHGHLWVQIGLVCWWMREAFCCPLRGLLYRREKDCPPEEFARKWELVLQLLDELTWPAERTVMVLADGAYCVKAFLRGLGERGHQAITRLARTAAVFEPPQPSPTRRGRPRIYGRKTSLAAAFARRRFRRVKASLWGWKGQLRIASVVLVPRLLGRPAKIVCVRVGQRAERYLLCTDRTLSAERIVTLYASRFSLELTFRELTQRCGFGDYQVRSQHGIERHVQLSQVACSLLHLVRITHGRRAAAQLPLLPWRKRRPSLSLGQTIEYLRQLSFQQTYQTAPPPENTAPHPDTRQLSLSTAAESGEL